MNTPKVGVILSVYKNDSLSFLNKSLNSIITQTYDNIEIHIGVDGYVDDTVMSYLNRIALEHKIHILFFEKNRGLAAVLNDLIDNCLKCGVDYIARMDADDISLPDRICKQVEYMESHQEIMVLGGAIQEIDENCTFMKVRHYPPDMNSIKRYICKASPLAHPTVMFRKKIFEQGFRYNINYKKSQDLDLWFRIIAKGYIISNIDDILLLFRRTSDTYKRRNKIKTIINEFKIYKNGIVRLYGYNWRLIYPILRFCFKFMPLSFIVFFYNTCFLKLITNK
jgi:glycosyltransferase involved in cell wall biosynthesis